MNNVSGSNSRKSDILLLVLQLVAAVVLIVLMNSDKVTTKAVLFYAFIGLLIGMGITIHRFFRGMQ